MLLYAVYDGGWRDDWRVAMFTFDGAVEKFGLVTPLTASLGFKDDDPCIPHSICNLFDLYRRFCEKEKT